MHPVLLKIGDLAIYTYGLFIAIGILTAFFVVSSESKRVGLNPDKMMDLCFYLVISGVIGSRLFYVITAPEMFRNDFWEIFRLWNGGLVFYGAFIGAFITGMVFVKKNKIPLWKATDAFAPSIAVGHALGRIGCFFAGCCYGKICDLPWAVSFTDPQTLARPIATPLHPTQLYSSASNFIIFIILMILRKRLKIEGQLFWIYVMLYGIARSVIETFRADFRGETFFEVLSVSQVIGWSMAVISVIMLIVLSRRAASVPKKNV